MKNLYSLLLFLGLPLWAISQSTTTATYSSGLISSQHSTTTVTTAMNSACPGLLTVNVPAGRYVTSVDVEYNMEASSVANAWISEQRTYLECVTTSTKEAAVTLGPPSNVSGVQSYARTGLGIANGVAPAGGVQFRLHAFRVWGGSGCNTSYQWIVNNTFKITVHHIAAPSCLPPTSPQVTSTGPNSATLSWTSGGSSNWQVEYGPSGFSPGSGTLVSVSSNPFVLSGLSPSTYYDFRVRDSCGVGDVSFWTGMSTFRTQCSLLSAPWSEDFESIDWVASTFGNVGSIDTCYSRNYANSFTWETGPPQFTSFGSGPSGDHTSGSGKYMFSEINAFSTTADSAIIQTPSIDLSPLGTPELSFWYHMYGFNIGSLEVSISNNGGASFTDLFTISGQQHSSKTAPWTEKIINLSSYANDTVILRFIVIQATFGINGDVSIDDIDIHEQPSCPKPSNLSATSLANGLNISWTSGGASNWQIEYGPAGFTPGSGTIVNASTNPFLLTGLSASTWYDVRVRDSCGAGDVSAWTLMGSFRTACSLVIAPWTEDFESVDWVASTFGNVGSIDTCFSRNYANTFTWETGPPQFSSFGSGPSGDHTSGTGKYIFSEINGFSATADSAVIESPQIDLSALGTPELSFWYHMYGFNIGTLKVSISNNGGATYTSLFSISGQQHGSKTAPWTEKIISLSAYANDTVQVKFVVVQATFGTNGDVSIDDVDIHEQPTCPKPSNLTATSLANALNLSWTSGGASNWQVEYGPAGFTPGSGSIVNASSNPFLLTGLSASTWYDVRVRDSCGVGDVSVWTPMGSFRTACSVVTAPWTEDFESADWVASTFGNVGSIDTCYSRNYANTFTWETGPPQFASFGSGPSGDHTSGSGKYIFSEINGFSPSGDSATIVSPQIDLSALTTPELSFWYHMYGFNVEDLRVDISNDGGATYTSIFSISGQQQNSKTDPWKEEIINLAAYANDTVQLKFVVSQTTFGTNGDVSIDDIDIHEQPSCPKPSNLQSISTVDGFILSWTSGGASNWQVEYGPQGFSHGSGSLVNVSTNPYTISGLSPNTIYDLYVRDSCGVGDVSAWAVGRTDTTLCSVFSTPYTQNFDGANWQVSTLWNDPGDIDQCWDRSDTVNFVWKVGQGPSSLPLSGPDADHTTGLGKYLFTDRIMVNALSTSLVSPAFDLNGLSSPELRFWYHLFGSGIDKLQVEVLSGSTWSVVSTITGQQQSAKSDPWDEEIISLSSYANDTIQVRIKGFRTSTGFYNQLAIDDFWIGEAPTCPRPDNLAITSAGITSLNLSWTTGGASNWQVGYRIAGSGAPLTIVAASSNPYTLTGLSPATSYEVYLRDSCGAGDVSFWEGPAFGTTLCGVVTAPWFENFDGNTWISGAAFDNAGNQVSTCWSRPSTNNPNFGARFGTTGSVATGPNSDVSGLGKFIYTEASGGATGAGQISSPSIFLPGNIQNPRLKFAYHMYGANIVDMKVQINNGSGFTNVKTITGQQQTSSAAPWAFDSVSLGSYTGDTIIIKFIGSNNGFNGDISVDNVEVKGDIPQCPAPGSIGLSSVNAVSAIVSWSSMSGHSELEVLPLGQPLGSGTRYTGATSPLALSGLSPSTTYLLYLRDSCGPGVFSIWVIDTLVTQACSPVTAGFTHTRNLLSCSFSSMATGADSTYWDFGDGNNSSLTGPSHSYLAPGTYTVSQRSYNYCGNGDTTTQIISVCDSLVARFGHKQSNDTVYFDASGSTGANQYLWYFGNGDTATGPLSYYVFSTSGNKSISLAVTNACNDTAWITQQVNVCAPPKAIWTYTNLGTTGSGMKIQFDGSNSKNAVFFEWDYGDGNTETGASMPVHIYVTPGLFYIVQLRVTNSCGDKNSWKYRLSEVGLEELDLEASLQLYPNPATDRLELEWQEENLKITEISITDGIGREVQELRPELQNEHHLQLDISGLASGYYLLQVHTNMGSVRKPFVKK